MISEQLKLHQLDCLIAVSDNGSVRRAADRLGRSPTAVSNALRELERVVGAVLLERRADGVVTTDAGKTLLAHARLIFGQLQRASEDVAQLTFRRGGTIRMAITPWLIDGVLPQVINVFRAQRPDVQLDVAEHLGVDYSAVRNGQLDFALGPLPDDSLNHALDARPLYTYSFAVVCRRDHPAANARSIAELEGYDWLLSRSMNQVAPAICALIEAQVEDHACHVHYARSVHAALALVRCTDMLSIIPWPLVEAPDTRHRYLALHLDALAHDGTTCVVTRRYEPLQGAAFAFLETFHQVARELAASADPNMRRIFRMVEAE